MRLAARCPLFASILVSSSVFLTQGIHQNSLRQSQPIQVDPNHGAGSPYSGRTPERETRQVAQKIEEPSAASEPVLEKGTGEGGEAVLEGTEDHHTGRIVACGLGATVILLALVVSFTQSANATLAGFTFCVVHNVVCIFLAVLVFQAVDELLVDSGLFPEEATVACCVAYAVIALASAVGVSMLLQNKASELGVFTACSAHFVSFAFMHAALVNIQNYSTSTFKVVLALTCTCLFIALLYFASHHLKRRIGITGNPELLDAVDDLETDAGAMGAAIAWTLFVAYFIAGEFVNIEEEEEAAKGVRRKMLFYALAITVLGAVVIPRLQSLREAGSYAQRRFAMFVGSFLTMCIAWGYLLFGKWFFHEHHFQQTPLFSRVVYAFIVSLLAMGATYLLATFGTTGYSRENQLILMALGLIVGWSWEEVFDSSIELLAEDFAGFHRGLFKLGAAALFLVVVLPVHILHLHPMMEAVKQKE